jgi:hypothetical protein
MRRQSPRRFSIARWIAYATCLTGLSPACSSSDSYDLCTEDCDPSGDAGARSSGGGVGSGAASGASKGGGPGASGNGGAAAQPTAGNTGKGGAPDLGQGGDAGEIEAGSTGSGGEGGASAVCDPSKSPNDEACVVSDEFAIFVDSEASSDGDGSMSSPFASLADALVAARDQEKLVIVCANGFDSGIEIAESKGDTPLKIYGGFDCSASGSWKAGDAKTVITSASGSPLVIRDSSKLELEGFEFRAPEATPESPSSIAAVISASAGIALRNVTLIARDGLAGVDGAAPEPALDRAPAGNPGQYGASGGKAQESCTCEKSVGGEGGHVLESWRRYGNPGLPDWGGGQGGELGPPCQAGKPGNAGPVVSDGKAAESHGSAEGLSWIPADGQAGGDGAIGQGGGGGGSGDTGSGGGGGCGGCGGKGGRPGTGGGASIGLLLLDSTITLADIRVETGNGGKGGAGSAGQEGQPGGEGGRGGDADNGCAGGDGAPGGKGAAGGGGAGGISVAIAYRGDEPDVSQSELDADLGAAGVGGEGGGDGLNGVSQVLLAID